MRGLLILVYIAIVGSCGMWIYTSYQKAHEPFTLTKKVPSGYAAAKKADSLSWSEKADGAMKIGEAERLAEANPITGPQGPKVKEKSLSQRLMKRTQKWLAKLRPGSGKKAKMLAKGKSRGSRAWKVVQRK